eukprot:350715-Chlamydomonas_euryale.AAC.5
MSHCITAIKADATQVVRRQARPSQRSEPGSSADSVGSAYTAGSANSAVIAADERMDFEGGQAFRKVVVTIVTVAVAAVPFAVAAVPVAVAAVSSLLPAFSGYLSTTLPLASKNQPAILFASLSPPFSGYPSTTLPLASNSQPAIQSAFDHTVGRPAAHPRCNAGRIAA